jgi:hypothetical protein
MTVRVLFVAILFLTACGQIKSTPEIRAVDSIPGSVKDTVITNTPVSIADSVVSSKKADTVMDCHAMLHELINTSTFDPEIKKFEFKVFVDTVMQIPLYSK